MKSNHPLDDPRSREATISLRAEVRHSHHEASDGVSEYVLDLFFEVFGEWAPEDSFENCYEIEAGEVHLRLVRLSVAMDEEAPLAELFDLDQSLTDLGRIYDWKSLNMDFHEEIHEVCGEANSYSDLFSIESMTLLPWARRQGVGLRIIEILLRSWQSGCSLAVINPQPYGRPNCEDGVVKLTRYFKQLGFKNVPGIPHLVRSIEMMPPNTSQVDLPEFLLVPSGLAEVVEGQAR
ncbi:hypothetical protein V2O64_09270 [Verrucomicrobiaceae bacterium 227]